MAALLVSLWLLPGAYAEVDGRWMISAPDGAGSLVLELKSDGGRLTGTLSGRYAKLEIANGSVGGNAISFEIVIKAQQRTVTTSYRGRVEGDEMHLTVRELGKETHVTAKRRDAGAPPLDWITAMPAPGEVVAWLKSSAVRLATVLPGDPLDDLAPLRTPLKDARVVAMGEATHGTREFFLFKHRMLRFLVEELGFTVFGIEASWPESLAVNDYVAGGKGDSADAARRLGFLVWQTEEVAGLLRWIRQYNDDSAHTRKLKVYGFDMQEPRGAASRVLEYLGRVDPERREAAAAAFAQLNGTYERASPDVKRRTAESLAAILGRFDERKRAYIERSSAGEWSLTRRMMVTVTQAEAYYAAPSRLEGSAIRDRAMAENVKWILDHEAPGTRVMLWTHNGHAGAEPSPHKPMGAHLRDIFGREAVLCGFLFRQGVFRALAPGASAMSDFKVGAPPQGSLDATFAAAGAPLFAVDLRQLPAGVVADWLDGPRISRQIGARYSEETARIYWRPLRAARAFDLLIFVENTSPSRRL